MQAGLGGVYVLAAAGCGLRGRPLTAWFASLVPDYAQLVVLVLVVGVVLLVVLVLVLLVVLLLVVLPGVVMPLTRCRSTC